MFLENQLQFWARAALCIAVIAGTTDCVSVPMQVDVSTESEDDCQPCLGAPTYCYQRSAEGRETCCPNLRSSTAGRTPSQKKSATDPCIDVDTESDCSQTPQYLRHQDDVSTESDVQQAASSSQPSAGRGLAGKLLSSLPPGGRGRILETSRSQLILNLVTRCRPRLGVGCWRPECRLECRNNACKTIASIADDLMPAYNCDVVSQDMAFTMLLEPDSTVRGGRGQCAFTVGGVRVCRRALESLLGIGRNRGARLKAGALDRRRMS